VQTTIEAAIGVEITQLRDLPNKLFCFKLAAPRETSKYLRFFLGEFDSPDQLLVRQQNREALESNLASLARKLDAAVEGMHSHPLLGSVELSRRDVLFFNVNHYCRPTLLYTNGRAAVSVVRRSQNRFEVVRHRSLSFFKTFLSDFGWTDCLIGPEEISIAHDFESAERLAREFLTRTLRMRKGASIEQVTLVPEEGSAVVDGYPVHVLVATFGTREFRLQFGGAPCGPREAFRVLNEFCPDGFVAEVCATCEHFRFSGMSRDMSAGSSGYCTQVRAGDDRKSGGRPPVVSVFHTCEAYHLHPDRTRYS
jgi:hypothetical protein